MLLVWLFRMPIVADVIGYLLVGTIATVVAMALVPDAFREPWLIGGKVDYSLVFLSVFCWPLLVVGSLIRLFLGGVVLLGDWLNAKIERNT